MITFIDGPAKGQVLQLRRAPQFLRVVRTQRGEFDALDQPDDEPRPRETIFAYRASQLDGTIFICSRGAGGRNSSGPFQRGVYKLVEVQPDDATMRDSDRWQKWCLDLAQDGELVIPISRGRKSED